MEFLNMKVHLLYGPRVACADSIPLGALLSASCRLVTCRNCRRTAIFKKISGMNIPKKKRRVLIHPDLFTQGG